jgi:AcrR family transcriptional regulator
MSLVRKKAAYHHGDLRHALIEASKAIIERDGVEALSLREAARHAGVSPAAPYHHFGSKAGLLGAIAGSGFTGLTAAMHTALASLDDPEDPVERLMALGRAYVDFALGRPTEFRLMFRPSLVSPADLPDDCDPSESFTLMLDAVGRVAPLLPEGLRSREALSVLAWSMVHGVSELVLEGPLGRSGPGLVVDPDQVGRLAVDAFGTMLRQLVKPAGARSRRSPGRQSS